MQVFSFQAVAMAILGITKKKSALFIFGDSLFDVGNNNYH